MVGAWDISGTKPWSSPAWSYIETSAQAVVVLTGPMPPGQTGKNGTRERCLQRERGGGRTSRIPTVCVRDAGVAVCQEDPVTAHLEGSSQPGKRTCLEEVAGYIPRWKQRAPHQVPGGGVPGRGSAGPAKASHTFP